MNDGIENNREDLKDPRQGVYTYEYVCWAIDFLPKKDFIRIYGHNDRQKVASLVGLELLEDEDLEEDRRKNESDLENLDLESDLENLDWKEFMKKYGKAKKHFLTK